jgi:hypothetical protein
MKKFLLSILIISFTLISCSSINYVNKKIVADIFPKDAVGWSLEECNKILNFYTADNQTNQIFQKAPLNQKVFVKALLLNKTSIKAMSRKEVIEKRLKPEEYYDILANYLTQFTSLKYDKKRNEIIEADPNFTKGYYFKIYFENVSDPYQPIFLEDGYSYFFLENAKGEFSRVTEVTGLFVEDYFQLDGYLDAIITFSPFSSNGKRMFETKDLNESYRLVFNGLQDDSIVIQWMVK